MTEFIFENKDDKEKFFIENNIEIDSIKELDELKIEISEKSVVLRRTDRKKRLKNFRKSKFAKKSWRLNRKKLMKGIKKFHKSTKGKRFHRALGRRLATKDNIREKHELIETLVGVQSLKTHLMIGEKYTSSIDEEVDNHLLIESIFGTLLKLEEKLAKTLLSGEYNFTFTTDESNILTDLILTNDGDLSEE